MLLRALTYAFWVGPFAILVFIAATMIRRKLRRNFPVFFLYTVLQIAAFCVEFAAYKISYTTYYCAYWSCNFVVLVIAFLVIREIFANLLRPYDALRDLGNVLFRWAAVVLVMVAITSVASGTQSKMHTLTMAIFALERSVRVMQCGLVLFMLLFGAHLGISSKNHVFGISLGFGVFAAVDLIIVTLYGVFGAPGASTGLNLLKSAFYALSTLIWGYYMLSPEPEPMVVQAREQTDRWNLALGSVQDPHCNFLPMVESVVEKVLSQRHIRVENDSNP
jgi:hypothetical protein